MFREFAIFFFVSFKLFRSFTLETTINNLFTVISLVFSVQHKILLFMIDVLRIYRVGVAFTKREVVNSIQ